MQKHRKSKKKKTLGSSTRIWIKEFQTLTKTSVEIILSRWEIPDSGQLKTSVRPKTTPSAKNRALANLRSRSSAASRKSIRKTKATSINSYRSKACKPLWIIIAIRQSSSAKSTPIHWVQPNRSSSNKTTLEAVCSSTVKEAHHQPPLGSKCHNQRAQSPARLTCWARSWTTTSA